jgi:hypothetical protein
MANFVKAKLIKGTSMTSFYKIPSDYLEGAFLVLPKHVEGLDTDNTHGVCTGTERQPDNYCRE